MDVKQIKFLDEEMNIFGGILIDNKYVVCGCCGAIFELPNNKIEIIEELRWINISEDILGD